MHIGLNLLHAHPKIGGGWNYIKTIVESLQSYDNRNIYTAYCTRSSKSLIKEQENTKIVYVGINSANRIARIAYENSYLQWRVNVDKIDVLHWFANTRSIFSSKPSVVTVYDLLAFRCSESHSLLNRIYKNLMFPLSMQNADIIAPMSETTKKGIDEKFDIDSKKMIVIPPIIDDSFMPVDSEKIRAFRNKYKLPDKYWLYVAHYYPHKNHERLFKAYALLKSKQNTAWILVLCGMKNGADKLIAEKLKDAGIEKSVIWLPRIEDSEMSTLYSAATALVFPSLYEGGGIPIMEAIACGCPVVASDLPTTKEFAGNTIAECFDGENIEDIANAMLRFESDNIIDDHKMRGLEKAKEYRKNVIIPRLLNAYYIAYTRSLKGKK
jgi:glycosyltransferase involved in cell wall biosynthesis